MDIVDRLFVAMFDSLNEKCKKALEAVDKQYPFEPLKVNLFIDYAYFVNVLYALKVNLFLLWIYANRRHVHVQCGYMTEFG